MTYLNPFFVQVCIIENNIDCHDILFIYYLIHINYFILFLHINIFIND